MSTSKPINAAVRPTQVLLVLLLAGVSFALSQTLVIPALPEIGQHLHASATATSWLLTAFLLSASIATPIVGKLGDIHGKGRVLTAVLLVFAVGAARSAGHQALCSASCRTAIACATAPRVACVALSGLSIMKSCVMPS